MENKSKSMLPAFPTAGPNGVAVTVIREIVFPVTEPGQPSRKFSFKYNSDPETNSTVTEQVTWGCGQPSEPYTRTVSRGMGDLSQVTTPSGAVVNYGYSRDGVHRYLDADDIPREAITQKQVVHDGTTDTWSYQIDPFHTGGTVTAPDSSVTTETSYSVDPASGMYLGLNVDKGGLVYRSNRSDKEIIERHWTTLVFTGANTGPAGANSGLVTFNPVVDAEYTTLKENGVAVKMSAKTYQYDYNGNLTSETDYHWFPDLSQVQRDAQGVPTGVPANATVLRVINNTYYNPAMSSTDTNVYAKRVLSSNPTPLILNAPKETTLGPSDVQFSYDSQNYGMPPFAGNLTSKSVWDDVDNKWITTSQTYGLYGNLESSTDGNQKVTRFTYDDPRFGLPNHVLVDPQNGTGTQTTSTYYDPSTGLVTQTVDPNNQITNIDYTNQLLNNNSPDPFGRPGLVIGPLVSVGGVNQHQRTKTFYADSSRTV